jgi:hypothetical protein
MNEREIIVAWMRSKSNFDDQLGHARLMKHLAACIEDGDHIEEKETDEAPGPWEDDSIQFPRLLAEIMATQDTLDMADLAEAMDLDIEDVGDLFDRAQAEWERIKSHL